MNPISSLRRVAGWLCLAACGCSAMRELPRDQYAVQADRGAVRVVTRTGQKLELERVRVSADSLTGLKRRDVEGRFEEFETVKLGLDDVAGMSVRRVDWYRTGLIGGVAVAVALAAVLSQSGGGGGGGNGGGGGPRPLP